MTQNVDAPQRGAFFWFDVLRWLAASLVVLEHLRDLFWLPQSKVHSASPFYDAIYFGTGLGGEAVAAFFVMSGFWITRSVDRRVDGERFWSGYLVDRLSRLMIVIVPALALGGACDLIGRYGMEAPLHRGLTGTAVLNDDIAWRLTLETLLGNLLFLQRIFVPTFGSNGPLWSLSNEFWYYIWFPALLLLIRERRLSWALPALLIGVVAPLLLPGFIIYLFGSVLAFADRRATERGSRYPGWTLVAATLVLCVALTASRLDTMSYQVAMVAVGAAFALFLWTLLRVDPRPAPAAKRLAGYGATASFSLYAIHFPLLALAAAIILQGTRMAPSFTASLWLIAMFLASLLAGWLFSRATEAQTGRMRRWLSARRAIMRNR